MNNMKLNHEQYKEWVQLSVYNELNSAEQELLNKHLAECESCRSDYAELLEINALIAKHKKAAVPSERMLMDMRSELRGALRAEAAKKGFFESMTEVLKDLWSAHYKTAISGAAVLVIGVMLGYYLTRTNTGEQNTAARQPVSEKPKQDEIADNGIKIDNLKIEQSDPGKGEVSVSFDAVKPVRMKGNIRDERIQKVLVHGLTNENNDGVRLRTISTIAEQTAEQKKVDPKIKAALIKTVKMDKNPGVRREALLVLQKMIPDKDITEAFLYVLSHDSNAGLRIAAINSLSPEKTVNENTKEELLKVLKEKSQKDNNQYIRIRAKSVLQEAGDNVTL